MKKIAIFHSFLDNIGGAEMVTLTLGKYLNADIYTTNINKEKIQKMGFSSENIFSIGRVPLNAPWRHQLTLTKFRHLNLKNKYSYYIIAGDWAVSAAVNHHPNLWYIHSPMREIWDLKDYTRQTNVAWHLRYFFDMWVLANRFLVRKYASSVDTFICNSKNTQQRVKKYLYKDANVLYPPVSVKDFYTAPSSNYWLSVNRLINHKNVDMQLQAFSALPNEKLVIVGSYEHSRHFLNYAELLGKAVPPNVTIKSWISRDELLELYANCRGFITTALDEDFGMTAVEAMAAGKPVIAPLQGGYKETVIDGVTGILIKDMDALKLQETVKAFFLNNSEHQAACVQHAAEFSTETFIEQIKKLL